MRRAFLLSLLVATLIAGCRPGEEKIQWAVRPKAYRSIVSLSPSATEVVASTSYTIPLVGRTAACDFPPQVSNAPIVAQVKPDYEKIKEANPGLVVYDASVYNEADIAQIEALGIDTFAFKAKTVDEYIAELRKLGTLLGSEMEVSTYIDKLEQGKKTPLDPKPKVALILPGKTGEHLIAGTSSFHADVVRQVGAEPVGPEADKYVSISMEALIKLNPDMIVMSGEKKDLDRFVADPRLRAMPAVAKGKVRSFLPSDLLTRMGYRVDQEMDKVYRSIMDMAGGN